MTDYSGWPEKMVAVTSLSLDPQNPRIPPATTPLDQRGLIEELVNHDKVLDLAKDIAADGYAPVESLIGLVGEDGKTYILEGNRRLAALKLLLSPDSAPQAAVAKVRSIAKGVDLAAIQKVRVLHAPSRQAAAHLIMQKHTRQQIEKWEPLMQARFYRTLAEVAGQSAADLAKAYGSTPGEIAQFLRTDTTYELARNMGLPASVQDKINDPRTFPVSTVQRLLDAPKARDVLGIDFDENGRIEGKVHPDEFRKGFGRILSDIANDQLNTRTINTKENVDDYLASIKGDLPDKKRKGSFTITDFVGTSATISAPAATSLRKTTTATTKQSASVIPTGTKCRVKNARIKEIFDELYRLRLDKNPNASAVLFRIFLELCIGHYLDKTKKIQPLLATAQKKKGTEWYPTLRQMLDLILKDTSITLPTLARKKLRKLISDSTSSLSVEGLDAYVHNRFSPPIASELRSYWDTFEELFAIVLEEPPVPSKAKAP